MFCKALSRNNLIHEYINEVSYRLNMHRYDRIHDAKVQRKSRPANVND